MTVAVREKRRIQLPAFGHRRSKRNPDQDQADARKRDALIRNAVDAIRAVVGQATSGDELPPGLAVLRDQTPTRHRRRTGDGGYVSEPSTRGRDLCDWLLRVASQLDACRYVRGFRDPQCGRYHPLLNSCKSRVCPNCERARSARAVAIAEGVLGLVDEKRRSYMVFTLRNLAVLTEGLELLDRAWDALRRDVLFRGGKCRHRTRDGKPFHPCAHPLHRRDRNCPDFRHSPVAGGLRFDEVTFNATEKTYHPHRNVLADAPYIVQAELSDTWRAITCTDAGHRRRRWCPRECTAGSPVLWIERVKPKTIRDAVKYVTKVTDLIEGDDPYPIVEFLLATRGRRMAQGFGSFFNVGIDRDEDPDPTVDMFIDTGDHDASGRPIVIRHRLPARCRACGRSMVGPHGESLYEPPIGPIPRRDLRLHNGVPTWTPPGGSP